MSGGSSPTSRTTGSVSYLVYFPSSPISITIPSVFVVWRVVCLLLPIQSAMHKLFIPSVSCMQSLHTYGQAPRTPVAAGGKQAGEKSVRGTSDGTGVEEERSALPVQWVNSEDYVYTGIPDKEWKGSTPSCGIFVRCVHMFRCYPTSYLLRGFRADKKFYAKGIVCDDLDRSHRLALKEVCANDIFG